MNGDARRPAKGRDTRSSRTPEHGFSALELLVVVVIVCVLAAIGVPTLHAKAKTTVLDANMRILAETVEEQVLLGYSTEYQPSGEGDPSLCLSARLEEILGSASEAGFVNPVVGADEGRAIVNSSSVPADPGSVPPAVLITNAALCRYDSFGSLAEAGRLALAGALIVAFNPETRTLDVFYVDESGKESATAVSIPMG